MALNGLKRPTGGPRHQAHKDHKDTFRAFVVMVTFVSWTNPSGDSPTAEPRTPEHPNDRTPDTCDPSPMSVGRITISRKDPRDVRDRQIITSIDGEPLATLLYGGEISREVPAGPHRLRAHNTLFWKTL